MTSSSLHLEQQRPRREQTSRIRRNQWIALLSAFILQVINAITGRAKGPDVSHWEKSYDPDKGSQSSDFAIMKLTEGTSWVDPAVDLMWQGVKKVLVRAGYHYLRSGMSVAAQIEHYLNIAARYDFHFHALDLEGTGNTYNDTFFADARRWIDGVRESTGKKVLLYTNTYTYNQFESAIKRLYSDGQVWLDTLEFWFSYPSSTLTEPPLPAGRETANKPWTFWQISWTATEYGTGAPTDLNVFNGNIEGLFIWAGLSELPPGNGDIMQVEGTTTASGGLYVRLAPGGTIIGYLPLNTYIQGDLHTDDNFIYGTFQGRNNSSQPASLTGCISAQYVDWKEIVTPPPAEGFPDKLEDTVTLINDDGTQATYSGTLERS